MRAAGGVPNSRWAYNASVSLEQGVPRLLQPSILLDALDVIVYRSSDQESQTKFQAKSQREEDKAKLCQDILTKKSRTKPPISAKETSQKRNRPVPCLVLNPRPSGPPIEAEQILFKPLRRHTRQG